MSGLSIYDYDKYEFPELEATKVSSFLNFSYDVGKKLVSVGFELVKDEKLEGILNEKLCPELASFSLNQNTWAMYAKRNDDSREVIFFSDNNDLVLTHENYVEKEQNVLSVLTLNDFIYKYNAYKKQFLQYKKDLEEHSEQYGLRRFYASGIGVMFGLAGCGFGVLSFQDSIPLAYSILGVGGPAVLSAGISLYFSHYEYVWALDAQKNVIKSIEDANKLINEKNNVIGDAALNLIREKYLKK